MNRTEKWLQFHRSLIGREIYCDGVKVFKFELFNYLIDREDGYNILQRISQGKHPFYDIRIKTPSPDKKLSKSYQRSTWRRNRVDMEIPKQ